MKRRRSSSPRPQDCFRVLAGTAGLKVAQAARFSGQHSGLAPVGPKILEAVEKGKADVVIADLGALGTPAPLVLGKRFYSADALGASLPAGVAAYSRALADAGLEGVRPSTIPAERSPSSHCLVATTAGTKPFFVARRTTVLVTQVGDAYRLACVFCTEDCDSSIPIAASKGRSFVERAADHATGATTWRGGGTRFQGFQINGGYRLDPSCKSSVFGLYDKIATKPQAVRAAATVLALHDVEKALMPSVFAARVAAAKLSGRSDELGTVPSTHRDEAPASLFGATLGFSVDGHSDKIVQGTTETVVWSRDDTMPCAFVVEEHRFVCNLSSSPSSCIFLDGRLRHGTAPSVAADYFSVSAGNVNLHQCVGLVISSRANMLNEYGKDVRRKWPAVLS